MDELTKKIDDHEDRIRDLEKERTETRIKLINIEKEIAVQQKNIAEFETSMKNDNRRIEDKIENLLGKMLEKQDEVLKTFLGNYERNNKNGWEVAKKLLPYVVGFLGVAIAIIERLAR